MQGRPSQPGLAKKKVGYTASMLLERGLLREAFTKTVVRLDLYFPEERATD